MSWYYVDKDGNTQGPKSLQDMQKCFLDGKLAPQSFVWNGADVNQWTPLNKVGKLLKSCQDFKKSKQQPKKPMGGGPPTSRPRRKSPFGGGGRSALLGAIQRGAKLRKAPKPQEKKVGQPAPKKPGQKLSLREQMALTLRRRKMGGGNKKSPKVNNTKPKQPVKTAPKSNNIPWSQRQKNNNNNKTNTTSSWNKNKTNNTSTTSYNKSSGSGNSRIDNITKKLKNAQEWQLKAIEKLLS